MKRIRFWYVGILMTIGLWIALSGCSGNGITNPNDLMTQNAVGIATEDMHFVNWKPQVQDAIAALRVQGIQAPAQLTKTADGDGDNNDDDDEYAALAWRYIRKSRGGTVGGESTFGNKVVVPDHAFQEHSRLFVVAVTNADPVNNTGAAVDFLPSQQFQAQVEVTLAWDYLDFDGDPANLVLYWQNEESGLWVEVPGSTINMEDETISGSINHFTRFAWAWEDDLGD